MSGMDRRRFLKFTTGGAVGAAVGAGLAAHATLNPFAKVPVKPKRQEIATLCQMCVNQCPVIAIVEDGKISKLNPNPESLKSRGMVCAKGNAGLLGVHSPGRIKKPLLRVGARGEGKWKPISWDEAFDFTAKQLSSVKEKYGPQGTLWASCESLQEVFYTNLAGAFGSPNTVRHPSLCLASVNLAYSTTFGTVPSFDIGNSKYIIMSGANRLEALMTPDSIDLIAATTERKARLIYLDPRFTVTASKADEWYPIRPGTDMAFILAMLNVIISEQRYKKVFVDTYTIGFDLLTEHVKKYTPEWAEAETEISAKDIQRIAREFADSAPRSLYYAGRRSSWYRDDFQMRRAQAVLNAIVGNWDRQGGVVPNQKLPLGEFMFLPWDDPTASRIDEIEKNFPLAAKDDGAYLKLRENVLAGTPYPVKAMMVYKQDPMNDLPDQGKTLRMLEQMDFIGVIDIQMSDTAWYADVIFPESNYLERQDPIEVQPGLVPQVVMRQPVLPTQYDTKPMLEIAQGLAKRLNLSQYFDYTIDQWNQAKAKELPFDAPLDYLKTHGVYVPSGYPKYGTTLVPEHRFVTESGKIELYSKRLQEHGYDPLPVYTSPAPPPPGQFRLVVGRKAYFTQASSTGNPWLNEFYPENDLWLNPKSAESFAIASGDRVEVSSGTGTVTMKVRVTPEIRPDCAFMLHGYGKRSKWQTLASRGASDAQVLETAWDKTSGGVAFHETFVKVRKV